MNQDILRAVLIHTTELVNTAVRIQRDTFASLSGDCKLRHQVTINTSCRHRILKQNVNHDCACYNCPIISGEVK